MATSVVDSTNHHISLARAAGALKHVDGHQIKSSEGTILISCPDGDRFHDLYQHHCSVCKGLRHHPLLLNGGALLLSPHSPIRGARQDGATLVRHTHAASRMKSIHTIVLYSHVPCGAAYEADLPFLEVMRLLIEGKSVIKQEFAKDIEVRCFLHVDYEPSKRRTYFVDRTQASEFLALRGHHVRSISEEL